MSIETILQEVRDERTHQDRQWGGAAHDDEHSVKEFHEFIQRQIGRTHGGPAGQARARFVKIAALAVAAVESIDRRAGE